MAKQTTISTKSDPACVILAQVKDTLRLHSDTLDVEAQAALDAAVESIELETRRALRVSFTVAEVYGNWPCNPVRFDWQPVKSISSITYYDSADSSQTVTDSNYRLLKQADGAAVLEFDNDYSLPSLAVRSDAVTVNYLAGYADIDSVPSLAKSAVRLKVRELFGDLSDREINANRRSLHDLVSQLMWGQYR